ncbi:hypothetical protein OUZ56_002401 [Daphnia magna]|uniref:Metalloendopeptidase n=2 Tax=Daphnia magna TaxID=35525 RepID=A0ABR0A5L2_9CRUS|nr:hypothetical protein OUZ56_002401 [Daphnia magna]
MMRFITSLFAALLLSSLVARSAADSDPTTFREPDTPMSDEAMDDLSNIPLGNADSEKEIPGEPLNPTDFQKAMTVSMDPPPRDKLGGDPIEIAGLFEGDIAGVVSADMAAGKSFKPGKSGTKATGKNAIVDMNLRWPSSVIPYVISASFVPNDRSVIARAMLEYHNKTCIRFVPRTNQRDYVHIMPGSGCSSNVGRTGGGQPVSLGSGCVYVGIVIHELMHAAGFWHEQSRGDRDNFIAIQWDNIINGMAYNFQKYNLDRIQYLGAPYDTSSVMHYDAFAFAKNRERPTIIAKKQGTELGQRRGFSDVDVMKLNKLYECGKNGGVSTVTTTMAPLVSTELPGKCEDSHKYCKIWSETGECTKNKVWMSVSCRKSCKMCGVDCDNFNLHCDSWAKTNECEKNIEYMKLYCPKSCGFCGIASSAACNDENRYCSAWAERGQCKANADYMKLHCKKSCGLC